MLCTRCGEALDVDGVRFAGQFPAEGLLCAPCRMAPPEFEKAVAYGVYEDGLRQVIHLLKYEGVRGVAKPLGRLLAHGIDRIQGDAATELMVIAVPLFLPKQRRRGYNQTVLLADAAMAELRKSQPAWKLIAAHGALKRVKDTESQFGLTASGRRRNLRGAFEVVDPSAIAGREVLLLDDIYTTGATARECSRVLRRAGASRVWVATLARAQKEMIVLWSSRDGT